MHIQYLCMICSEGLGQFVFNPFFVCIIYDIEGPDHIIKFWNLDIILFWVYCMPHLDSSVSKRYISMNLYKSMISSILQ